MRKSKTYVIGIFTSILLVSGIHGYSQNNDCKVNLPGISGTYYGECKNGLAHGKGVAQGVDLYTGQFREGLPHGKGTYTWSNGKYYEGDWKYGIKEGKGKLVYKDSVVSGYWRGDEYIGEKLIQPYRITRSLCVVRSSIKKINSSDDEVRIRLLRGGVENAGVEDFSMAFTSGEEFRSGAIIGLQNPHLPLDIKIMFNAWNYFHTAKSEVVFEFTINEPGTWDVAISY